MSRLKSEPTASQATLGGTLGPSLTMHAGQRCHYFFVFLFSFKGLGDRMRGAGATLAPAEGVSVKATHQIATGLRSTDAAYYGFDETDPKVVGLSATACGRTDAAHYCNLGLTAPFMLAAGAQAGADATARAFFEMVQAVAGATRQLPQRVNIGPDRIVDQAHGALALAMLDGSAPVTVANFARYLDLCAREMAIYRAQLVREGKHGLAACCDCYTAFYDGSAPGLWGAEGVWRQLRGTIDAECAHHRLDRSHYLGTAVA